MSRYFVFYLVACLLLFASLTGLFQTLGLHENYAEDRPDSSTSSAKEEELQEPPPFTKEEFLQSRPASLDFERDFSLNWVQPLINGYYYQIGDPVPIYDSRDLDEARVETIPEDGVFKLEESIKSIERGWIHTITVSDGVRNYTMYMKHSDLQTWEFYGQGPPQDILELHQSSLERYRAKMKEREQRIDAAYEMAVQRYREAEKLRERRNPLREGVVRLQESLAQFDANGLFFNALVAGVMTFLAAFLVGTIGWLRNSRAWESDFGFDDIDPGAPYGDESRNDEERASQDDHPF